MDGISIAETLRKDSILSKIFIGVYSRDELPENFSYPTCFIINNKPKTHSGEHWLAFFYDSNKICYFFDSYANNPEYYDLTSYIQNSSSSWYFNKKRIQGNSNYCGLYCMLFLTFISRNKIKLFYDYFNENYENNDKKLSFLIHKYLL
jgi:hypothetical protein